MPAIVDTLRYVLELDDKGFRAGADQAERSVTSLAGSISGALTAALGALAAAFAAIRIGDFIKDATLTAARTEVLGTVLDVVGKNANVSVGRLKLLEEQVKSLGITTQSARESIIKFIQSGLPLEKIAQLARLAQNSAIIAQTTSAEAFDRLVRGIQTGQIELIRSAGVFISVEQALNAYARASGKAREGISDLERQTVILNAVLAQGDKVAGNYTAAMEDAGKRMTSLPRIFEEMSNSIGNKFLPILNEAIPIVEEFGKAVESSLTNDVIEANRAALGIDASRADQMRQIIKTQDEIHDRTRRLWELTQMMMKASDPDREGAIGAALGYAKAFMTIPRITAQIEELRKQLAALAEAVGPGIDLKISTAFQDPTFADREKKMKAVAEALEKIRKATPAGGFDIPVTIRMETADEALLRQLTGQDLGPNEISVIIDLDDQNFRNELEAAIAETEQKFQRILRPVLTQEFPGGEMSAITQEADRLASLQEAADVTKQKFTEAFRNIQAIASSVFRAIAGEAGQVLDDILGALGNFATGNIAGGIAGIISGFAGIFSSTTDTTNRLILSNRDLIRAINDWRDSIFRLTDQEKAEQADAARQFLDLVNRRPGGRSLTPGEREEARSWLEDAGIPIPAGATWEQLVEIARSILAGIGDMTVSFDAIQAADTSAERTDLIRGVKSFSEGLTVLQGLIDLFDLSPEEQLKMWQDAFRIWSESGLLSDEDKLWLANKMDDLKDSIDRQPQGATQTERSIARITERQADTLVSALATLDLHLREGFQNLVEAFNNWTANAFGRVSDYNAATVGIGGITVGPVYIQPKTATGEEIAAEFTKVVERELRAAGGLMLKGSARG